MNQERILSNIEVINILNKSEKERERKIEKSTVEQNKIKDYIDLLRQQYNQDDFKNQIEYSNKIRKMKKEGELSSELFNLIVYLNTRDTSMINQTDIKKLG